jgi:hypothetical protein
MRDCKCCGCRYYNSTQWFTTCSHCSRYYTDKYESIMNSADNRKMSLIDALREEYNRRIQAGEEPYDY